MPPEIVVPIAAFAVFFLGRLALGPRREPEPDPQAAAKCFIEGRIDAHIERLSRAYLQPGAGSADGRHVGPAFAGEIEAFIGNVVLWDALSALDDDEVSTAVRELVVLERQYVYDQILARVRAHLEQPAEAVTPDGYA